MLYSVNLTSRTTGADIFEAVDSFFKEHNLNYENIVGCCTDGAAAMMVKNIGFNTRLKVVAPHCRIIHCFIHRQALAAKKLSTELHDVMNVCVK